MKTRGLYRSLGKVMIAGRRVAVAEHKHLAYFKIGDCSFDGLESDFSRRDRQPFKKQ